VVPDGPDKILFRTVLTGTTAPVPEFFTITQAGQTDEMALLGG
jgi:hypothetical protein